MTGIIDVVGLTREELDVRVQELVRDGGYQNAADMIADWVHWDFVGRYEQLDAEVAEFNEPPKPKGKAKRTVSDRLTDEFGPEVNDLR